MTYVNEIEAQLFIYNLGLLIVINLKEVFVLILKWMFLTLFIN